MMKKQKAVLVVLLSALFLLGDVLPCFFLSSAEQEETVAEIIRFLDFSEEKGALTRELSAAFVYEAITGKKPLQSEQAYFENNSISVRYTFEAQPEFISYERSEDGFLVTAREYDYIGVNGQKVTWIPNLVTVGEKTQRLEKEKDYTVYFGGLNENVTYDIWVEYSTDFKFSQNIAEMLVNAPYNEGKAVLEEQAEYDRKLAEYDRLTEQYNRAYVLYLEQSNEYAAYLRALSVYEKEKAEYDTYIARKKNYEEKYALWQKYLEQVESYEKALGEYERLIAEYNHLISVYEGQYEALQSCRRSMKTLESVFVSDSVGHMMYNTLKGETVATVLDNQDKLVEYGGVSREDILNAGSATERLIAVLTPYRSLKTEEEKFFYYKEHYEEIKSQFILLYSSLNSLCKNGVVRSQLQKKGKLERYYQFLSQLYVISTGLDDAITFSPEWEIRGNTVYDLLESCQIIGDGNDASPAMLLYPSGLSEPIKPVLPEAPTKMEEPKKDWTVELTAPVLPAAVKEPVKPASVTVAKPDIPAFTSEQMALLRDVQNGVLVLKKVSGEHTVKASAEVLRKASFSNHAVVTFYDYDRRTILYSASVRLGDSVIYSGEAPERAADKKYTYAFSGWVDERGNKVDATVFENVREDRFYYASYDGEKIRYKVTFSVRDQKITEDFFYGDMPKYQAVASYTQNGYEYTFRGWSPAFSPVSGNAEYTALYSENVGNYTVTFDVQGVKTFANLKTGELPHPPEVEKRYIDNLYLYEFSGWFPEIVKATEDASYTALYTKRPVALTGNGGMAAVSQNPGILTVECGGESRVQITNAVSLAAEKGSDLLVCFGDVSLRFRRGELSKLKEVIGLSLQVRERMLTIAFLNENGEEIPLQQPISAEILYAGQHLKSVEFYRVTEKGSERLQFNAEGDGVLLTLTGKDEVVIKGEYTVSTVAVGKGYVKTNLKGALQGEKVEITVHPEAGSRLKELYLEVEGEKTVLTSATFEMPAGNVTVKAEFEEILYTVIFAGEDGKEISRKTYKYGEMPELPLAPEKASQGDIRYSFTRWNPEVVPVTQDRTYTPIFTVWHAGSDSDPYESPYDSDRFFTRVVLKYSGILLLCILPVPLTVVAVRRTKKEKNKIKKTAKK